MSQQEFTRPSIATLADAMAGELEQLYRELHAAPELSMQETETLNRVTAELEQMGYRTEQLGGGVVGILENGEGATVLLRADMDALPVKESTGLDYASTVTAEGVPVMHACGHDMHMAAGLGAARLLAEHRELWSGTYLALFQPGEETAAGARSMVDAGLVARLPKPDVALAQHVLASPASGEVSVAAGPVLSTATSLRITVFGTGSHGSMPHLGVDPVVLASAIVLRLQAIVSRELAPGEFGVVTVGSLQAGTSANIIPAEATLLVNVRAYSEQTREQLVTAIERIVRAECEASNSPAEPTIEVENLFPLTENDDATAEKVRAAFVAEFGDEAVKVFEPATASEDFSLIPSAFGIPYCYWGFGAFTAEQTPVANHNPAFAPALQPTLSTGVRGAAAAALAWLGRDRQS